MGDIAHAPGQIRHEYLDISVDGISVKVSATHRQGALDPILFLHGFGGSKEDYLDIALNKSFNDRAFVAFDAPGCGRTAPTDYSKISIPFLAKTAQTVLQHFGISRFHLVGHSMGALTALELAALAPESVLSFVNMKGNLAPEDCFLSRQIFTWADEDPEAFLTTFIERNYHSPLHSAALYASNVRSKVHAKAVRGIFESMVHLSDEGDLLAKFLALPFPRMYMYGEQYSMLSYIPALERGGLPS
ncbi:hypothetical protein LQW54_007825 [Pestalotiopsis sp. IQ-011]